MVSKKITLLMLLAVVIFLTAFSFVFAQDRELEVDYPDIVGATTPETVSTPLPEYIKYIFNFVIVFAGIIMLYALIKGGSLYLTSAGNAANMKLAKDQISSAFLGVVILLGSYIILTTINPRLAILNLPPFIPGTGAPPSGPLLSQEEASVIYYEIPIGQMVKNGVWKTELVESMTNTNATGILDDFEKFLNEEITAGGETSYKISDLNKRLKSLAETCTCDDLTPLCTKPENFAQETDKAFGCTGDPCKENREAIQEIIDTNSKKIQKIKGYKKELEKKLKAFLDEQTKFLNNQEKFAECLRNGFLLSQGDYLQSVRYYEQLGIETEVVQSYVPSRGDPLTFYCTVGGTTFDIPVNPADLPPLPVAGGSGEIELPPEAVSGLERLSCPGIIPVGEMIDLGLTGSFEVSDNNDYLIGYIDYLMKELKNMGELISEFNEQNCEVECKCDTNRCFIPPIGAPCPPFSGCVDPLCMTPPCWPTSPSACEPKERGMPYYGLPGPIGRPKDPPKTESVTRVSENIKFYEVAVFEVIKALKTTLTNPPLILETPQPIPVDLVNITSRVAQFCKNDNIEDPTWVMLNCDLALGNKGPDGNDITECHSYDFFCCTNKQEIASYYIDEGGDPTLKGKTSYRAALPSGNTRTSSYSGIDAALGLASTSNNCANISLETINFMGKTVKVHSQAKESFIGVNNELSANPSLQSYFMDWTSGGGGTHNCRVITGGTRMSPHAYGIAIDIKPSQNPYNKPKPASGCRTTIPQEAIDIFKKYGFTWGGEWRSLCDAMHFDWMGWKY